MPTHRHPRDPSIDIARAIGMLLVMYGHALEMFFLGRPVTAGPAFLQWQFIYSFHMPLFFVLSGMLFRNVSVRHTASGSLELLLIAYAAHAAGWSVSRLLDGANTPVGMLLFPVLKGYQFYTILVWFLVALALVRLSYWIIINSRPIWRGPVIAVPAALSIAAMASESYHFQFPSLLPGLLLYAFGHWLARSGILDRGRTIHAALSLAAFAAVAILAPLNGGCPFDATGRCGHEALHGDFAVWMAFGRIGFIPAFAATAVLGSLAVLWAARAIAKHPTPISRGLSWIGTRTLDLLVINGFVLQFVQPHLRPLIADDLPPQIMIASGVALTTVQIALSPLLCLATKPLVTLPRRAAQAMLGMVPRGRAEAPEYREDERHRTRRFTPGH